MIRGGTVILERLCSLFETGHIHFRLLKDDDFAMYPGTSDVIAAQASPGYYVTFGHRQPGRSDIKKSHYSRATGQLISSTKRYKKGPKTPATIIDP